MITATKLRINGEIVFAQYLPFESKVDGSVVRLLVQDPLLHTKICISFKERLKTGGIMDKAEIQRKTGIGRELRKKKFSEIRINFGPVLWIVDHLRSDGFSVIEEDPYVSDE